MESDKIVVDLSLLLEGLLSQKIETGEIVPRKLIIPLGIISYFEALVAENKVTGQVGLAELDKLKQLSQRHHFELESGGKREPWRREEDPVLVLNGATRTIAWEEGALLLTSDKTQALLAHLISIPTHYIEPLSGDRQPAFEQFFDEQTMSLHLRENTPPTAKKGKPGHWKRETVSDTIMTRELIQTMSREIVEKAKTRTDSVMEIERRGSTVVQLGTFRIVITEPPFSDGWEITAVRAVAHLELDDYHLPQELHDRLTVHAEGILVAGSPGEGKSTLSRALAEYLSQSGRIVKTVESPRDMMLSEGITQYSLTNSEPGEIHDVLLLSRPDNTFFDEMRNADDFRLFTDLRLAGIGMVGVVHATRAIDAIQRFIGKVEMGIIPQIVDTVIFVKGGVIDTVLTLNMIVKVPSGMQEADLARPVIEIHNFNNNQLEYEMYTYGEQTVVVPVSSGGGRKKKAIWEFAEQKVREYFGQYTRDCTVELTGDENCVVSIPEEFIARIIGKEGKHIASIEKELGLRIDIRPLQKKSHVSFDVATDDKYLTIYLKRGMANKEIELYDDDNLLLSVTCGNKGMAKIKVDSPPGRSVLKAFQSGTLRVVVVE